MNTSDANISGIVFAAQCLSLDGFEDRTARAATALQTMGVAENSTVLLIMRNDTAYLEALAALTRLGAYSVPVNWHATPDEVAVIVADSEARFAVVHDDLLETLATCPDGALTVLTVPSGSGTGTGRDAPAALRIAGHWNEAIGRSAPMPGRVQGVRGAVIYTSGTTSAPKAIDRQPMTPAQADAMSASLIQTYGFRPGMRALVCGPLYHSMSVSYAQTAIRTMGESGLLVLEPRFDATRILSLIDLHRITHLLMVPVMFVRLLKIGEATRTAFDLSCIEAVTHSAAPCSREVKTAMIDWWGPVLNEFYGASETGPVTMITSAEYLRKPGSVGRALPGCTVRVLNTQGAVLPAGQSGEIAARNASYPDFTYRHRPEERRKLDRDGLIASGDIGYLDDDGYLFLLDRQKDMVITGGVNVFPAEIESILLGLRQVKDCAVFGIPDEEFGESMAAHVELWPGEVASADEMTHYLKARLPSYKVPKRFEIAQALPRDDNGKIAKRRIADAYWQGTGRRI